MSDEIILQEQGEPVAQEQPAMAQEALEFAPAPPPEIGRVEASRRFSRIGFALLAMVAVQQGGAIALYTLIGRFPALAGNTWLPILANFLPLYLLALPAFILILRGQKPMPRQGEKRRVPGGIVAQFAFAGYLSMILSNLVVGLGLYALIGMLKGSEAANPLTSLVMDGNPFAVLPFALLGAPLLEEYVFRGMLLKHLGAFGAKPYILFSALTFALFHANLAQTVYAFALGLIFAGLTYYSGTIKYAVIAHMGINLVGSGLPVLALRLGGDLGVPIVGVTALGFAVAGIVSAALLLPKRNKLALVFEPASMLLPKGVMVQNAGMALFIVVLAALTVVVLVV